MTPDCERFNRWLDDGRPDDDAARAHAAACPRCASALAAETEWSVALESYAVTPAADFAERTMARVAAAPRPGRSVVLAPAVEWWVRAAADPACALSLAVAGLLVWRGSTLLSLLSAGLVSLAAQLPRLLAASALASWPVALAAAPTSIRSFLALGQPLVPVAFTLALMPLVAWGSWQLFRWAEIACLPWSRRRR